MKNLQRRDEDRLALAEERLQPDEEEHLEDIIDTFTAQMRGLWNPGYFERGGNTKTHGIVRAEFTVRDDLPEHMRRGIFAEPRTYRAWVRFSGPGPYMTPDIDDVGFMSMSIKLMGVPGPKLLDDEQFTQDMFGVSTPTFVTPDTQGQRAAPALEPQERAALLLLQPARAAHPGLDHEAAVDEDAVEPARERVLQLRARTCSAKGRRCSTRSARGCKSRTRVPRLPRRPPDNYLRDAMVATLAEQDVEFDILLQVQTDPFLMPIENNAVLWPTRLSPRVPAAVLRIPSQTFDSPEQLAFARVLSFNPWHSIAEHRPLGNQSRARKRHVLRAVTAAAADERRRALRADGRRDLLTPMEAPLWTYPLTVVPLVGFCILIGTGVGWWFAAAIFVPALILIGLAIAIGLRRKAERRPAARERTK